MQMIFRDRIDATEKLAEKLGWLKEEDEEEKEKEEEKRNHLS
jgi:ribosome assembly protein YihI (activator of Der GTPase)